jgi:hypothetical protein
VLDVDAALGRLAREDATAAEVARLLSVNLWLNISKKLY